MYELLTMEKRMNEQALPTVEIVDMREELRDGNRSMFSKALHEKIADRLEKRTNGALLNRRGILHLLCAVIAGTLYNVRIVISH